ncbi:hypothetical protein B7494_g2308 [Chlorociboria aeruginascens]|nr:hypothetical protein B7494_g2308 [Chlorociboria aeruginascens]
MAAKSIFEADGKAILNYHLTRAPVIKPSPLPKSTTHNAPPKLASLYFPEDAEVSDILDQAEVSYPWLLASGAKFVAKPDQLIKRRGKSGLLALNKTWPEAKAWIAARAGKAQKVETVVGNLRQFLVEPFVPHPDGTEYYININSQREGDWILFTHEGGVDVGDVDAKAEKLLVPVDLSEYPSNSEIAAVLLKKVPKGVHNVLVDFITRLYAVYVDCQFTYLEINPLVVIPNAQGTSAEVHFLDLAAKLDQTAEFECGVKWAIARSPAALGMATVQAKDGKVSIDAGPPMEFPAPFGREMSKEEAYIAELDAKTGASLKLTILNANGRVWTLVAGGGASVVYADAIASSGFADELANYGEYSGAPTETQTYHYARTVLDLMLRAPITAEGKVLFIGGGIANFTNVASTFKGVIKALREVSSQLIEHNVKIWVRRAGPNYQEGLKNIKSVGQELKLDMHVYGPDMHSIDIKGADFVNSVTGDRFQLLGVAYQPAGQSGYDPASGIDPLTNGSACLRDAALMQQLGVNAIRVYNVDPYLNHDDCASIFNEVGMYMLIDVNSPLSGESIDRDDPAGSYTASYLNRTFAVVEAFKNYPNTLLFFAGNEIINDVPTGTTIPPYIRAVTRDLKNYIAKHSTRSIPVGYSAADVRDNLLDTWNYLQCTTTGDASDPSRSDLFALNSYSWCGDSSFTASGYDVLVSDFSKTTVPVFFSEYGCNVPAPRIFTEVPVLYGPLVTPTLSGGLVYEYSQEDSNFGLVVLNSNGSAQLRSDYDTLQSQFNTLNVTALQGVTATNTTVTPPTCASSLITTSEFYNNFTIPDVPSGAQDLIDNGIPNPNNGKIVTVSSTKVTQTVQGSNGDIISGLAIKPLANDQSNSPGGSSTTTSTAASATSSKKGAAGKVEHSIAGLFAIKGLVALQPWGIYPGPDRPKGGGRGLDQQQLRAFLPIAGLVEVKQHLLQTLDQAAFAEAQVRDATATRAFSAVPIKTSNGQCLFVDELSGDFRANLTPIQVAACDGSTGQAWDIITAGVHDNVAGTMLVVNTLTQACLNFDPRRAAGNTVIMFSCGGRADGGGTVTNSQEFAFNGTAGPLSFTPGNAVGTCLAVTAQNVLDQAPCSSTDATQFFTLGNAAAASAPISVGSNSSAAANTSISATTLAAVVSASSSIIVPTTAISSSAPATITSAASVSAAASSVVGVTSVSRAGGVLVPSDVAESQPRDDTATRAFSAASIKTSDGQCLFVDPTAGDFRENLIPVAIQACDGSAGEQWDIITAGVHNNAENSMLVVSSLTQGCLNFDPRRAVGDTVILFSCGGRADGGGTVTNSQLFPFTAGETTLTLAPENAANATCLFPNGAKLDSENCSGAAEQTFTIG